jgi:GAF domain-containing protein
MKPPGDQLELPDATRAGVDRVLAAALAISGAERGNVQVRDPDGGLRIVAQRGFGPDFLDHFAVVRDDGSACGRAAGNAAQTVIVDVDEDPGFAPHRPIAAAAGFRAVVSTPLIGSLGLLGVVSTHFSRPHRPAAHELDALRQIGHTAGFALSLFPRSELMALAWPVRGEPAGRGAARTGISLSPPALAGLVRLCLDGRGAGFFFALATEAMDALELAAAGVSLAGSSGLRTVAAPNDRAAVLELVQERSAAGPRIDAWRGGLPVLVADVATHAADWDEFSWAAANLNMAAVAAIPITLGESRLGVLDLYRHAPHRWATEEVKRADRLARMAANSAFEFYRAR